MRRAACLTALALCAVVRAQEQEDEVLAPTPQGGVRGETEGGRVARLEALVKETRAAVVSVYGGEARAEHLADGVEYLAPESRGKIVERLLRALVLGDSFVIAVGGMSDVVAHGNMFEESYPMVARDVLRPVFEAAGIQFDIRNMAAGGIPSYPNSVCMRDNFGADADVVVWDFRMVEAGASGNQYQELYVRQAMLMPRAPFIMFKRPQRVLKSLTYAFEEAALVVVDETVPKDKSARDLFEGVFADDKFCENECNCPGQVKWHAKWKVQRFRGHHLALYYLDLLEATVGQYGALLGDGAVPGQGQLHPDDPRWLIKPRTALPPAVGTSEKWGSRLGLPFASTAFRCAMSWTPHVGPSLVDLVDPQLGLNGWKLQHAKPLNPSDIDRHKECHYPDDKLALRGDGSSHWVFFNIPNVKDGGMVGFCGDFKSFDFASYALIMMNQEEVMDDMTEGEWLTARTLGIQAACFATTKNVVAGTNVLGFRVTSDEPSAEFGRRGSKALPYMFLSHLVWEEA